MLEFNSRVRDIAPSATLALTSKAKALKAAGADISSFAAGEPDFDTPDHIKMAAIKALAEGQTKYAPTSGLPALRETIAAKLKRDNNLDCTAANVIVSNGAKHSLFNALFVLCDEGDEVIIPTPAWLSYEEMVRMAGAKPVFVETSEADGFAVRPEMIEKVISKKTKAIILNSPSNPTGVVYDEALLRAVADWAVRHHLYVISDEIYETFLYDGAKHVSIGSFGSDIHEHTITINGFSKAYSMTGWRLGYLAAPKRIAEKIGEVQSHATSGPNTFAMYGALAALESTPPEFLEAMRLSYDERRNRMYGLLTDIKGISCVKPQGAFYMVPNIEKSGMKAAAFAARLLEEKQVVVVPCEPFGSDKHVRLSYACGMANIEKGLARLREFMDNL